MVMIMASLCLCLLQCEFATPSLNSSSLFLHPLEARLSLGLFWSIIWLEWCVNLGAQEGGQPPLLSSNPKPTMLWRSPAEPTGRWEAPWGRTRLLANNHHWPPDTRGHFRVPNPPAKRNCRSGPWWNQKTTQPICRVMWNNELLVF